MLRVGQAGLLPEPRALQQARHEPDAALVEARPYAGVLQERRERDAAVGVGAEARVVHQVHRARPEHHVQHRRRGWQERGQEHVRRPERAGPGQDLLGPQLRRLEQDRGGERHRHDGQDVVHHQLVQRLETPELRRGGAHGARTPTKRLRRVTFCVCSLH
uniref:Uncharacterized protein n=1 Tax=Arundo donax TaxID=35708 RepID=A0A0A9D0U4_ARUDO